MIDGDTRRPASGVAPNLEVGGRRAQATFEQARLNDLESEAHSVRTTVRAPSRWMAAMILTLGSCAYTRAEIPSSPAPDAATHTCFESCMSLDDMDAVRCVARCPGAIVSDNPCSDSNPWCVDDKHLPNRGIGLILVGVILGVGLPAMLWP